LLDNDIQKVNTFHRSNLDVGRAVPARITERLVIIIVEYTEQMVEELRIASHWEQKGYELDNHKTAARTLIPVPFPLLLILIHIPVDFQTLISALRGENSRIW